MLVGLMFQAILAVPISGPDCDVTMGGNTPKTAFDNYMRLATIEKSKGMFQLVSEAKELEISGDFTMETKYEGMVQFSVKGNGSLKSNNSDTAIEFNDIGKFIVGWQGASSRIGLESSVFRGTRINVYQNTSLDFIPTNGSAFQGIVIGDGTTITIKGDGAAFPSINLGECSQARNVAHGFNSSNLIFNDLNSMELSTKELNALDHKAFTLKHWDYCQDTIDSLPPFTDISVGLKCKCRTENNETSIHIWFDEPPILPVILNGDAKLYGTSYSVSGTGTIEPPQRYPVYRYLVINDGADAKISTANIARTLTMIGSAKFGPVAEKEGAIVVRGGCSEILMRAKGSSLPTFDMGFGFDESNVGRLPVRIEIDVSDFKWSEDQKDLNHVLIKGSVDMDCAEAMNISVLVGSSYPELKLACNGTLVLQGKWTKPDDDAPIDPSTANKEKVTVTADTELTSVSDKIIVLKGNGLIRPQKTKDLNISMMTVETGSNITARKLRVKTLLTLEGTAKLSADENDGIQFSDRKTIFLFQSENKELPTLDLGSSEKMKTARPQLIFLAFDVGALTEQEVTTLDHTLIQGKTIGDCESWLDASVISDPFHTKLECEQLPATDNVVAIKVKGRTIPKTPVTAEKETAITSTHEPVRLEGTGTIIPASHEETIYLPTVKIESGSKITAKGLIVDKTLELAGSSSLKAAEGEKITIASTTSINLKTTGKVLPSIDLGEIGQDYKTIPNSIKIEIDVTKIDNWTSMSHTLISGRTLSNCEDWIPKVSIDTEHFGLVCETASSNSKILGPNSDVISLVMKGKTDNPSTEMADNPSTEMADNPSTEMTSGEIAGVVVGCVVAVAIVVIIVVVVVTRQKNKTEPSSSSVCDASELAGSASGTANSNAEL